MEINVKIALHLIFTVFTHIYSLLIDKDLCESRNISIKCPCALLVYLCLSSRDPSIFFSKFHLFIPTFLCYPYFGPFYTCSIQNKDHNILFNIISKEQHYYSCFYREAIAIHKYNCHNKTERIQKWAKPGISIKNVYSDPLSLHHINIKWKSGKTKW